ncbi:MAG: PepSY domain-containing protein [Spirulina sp. SIO3F2]|nr:PepSY domain-containing protein [Spirulina sp. SIO3F2]
MAPRPARQLHRALAPLMVFPLTLTLVTGVLFHIAALTGQEDQYLWLLALHRGRFGSINLEAIYVFFNGAGLLFILATGLMLWLQSGRRKTSRPPME